MGGATRGDIGSLVLDIQAAAIGEPECPAAFRKSAVIVPVPLHSAC